MQKRVLVIIVCFMIAMSFFVACGYSKLERDNSGAPAAMHERSRSNDITMYTLESIPVTPGSEILPAENRDDFMKYEINGFKNVLEHPKSTFSTDVDSAMYTFCKRMIEQNSLPEPEAVRVEEFLNYFNYDYPAPKDKIFAMYSEIAENPFNNGETAFLRLALKAKEISNADRRPAHLTFLIDVSGSMMASDKLELVKTSMEILVNHLKDGDTVGMCTYASGAQIVLEPTRDKSEILGALSELQAGGSTAGAAGLTNAYALANDAFVEGEINRVIMCTDGDFNVGVTDSKELEKIINEKSQKGISLSIFGFGRGNLQDSRMKYISKTGNGNYYYIGSKKDAQRVVGDKLASTLEIVASNTKIQIEFNPAYVDEYRLVGYEVRALKDEDFDNDLVDAGDVGPGHNVTAIYELKLRKDKNSSVEEPEEIAGKLGIFKIRYKNKLTDKDSHLMSFFIENDRKSFSGASSSFKFAVGVTGFGEVLRNSKFAKGWRLTTAIDCVKDGKVKPASDRKELIELIRKAISLRDKAPETEDEDVD